MKNIILVGMPGSGKSTLGKMLARELDYRFFDLDEAIEIKTQTSIAAIFAEQGEAGFRTIERETLIEILTDNEGIVLASGGGTPCFFDNMETMNKLGNTIWLNLSLPLLVSRLKNSYRIRPLLAGKTESELSTFLSETLEKRKRFYSQSKHQISCTGNSKADLNSCVNLF